MSLAKASLTGLKDFFSTQAAMSTSEKTQTRLVLQISPSAPLYVVDALKQAFVPQTTSGLIHIDAISEQSLPKVVKSADACIVVSGGDLAPELICADEWVSNNIPTLFITSSAEDAYLVSKLISGVSCALADTQRKTTQLVAQFLIDTLDDEHATSLATCFPFLRNACASKLTQKVAISNGVVGAIDLIHGADFPVMLAAEATLLGQLSALYQAKPSYWRLADYATLFAWGLATRSVTRAAEKTHILPKPVIRASLAFASTYVLGWLISARFSGAKEVEKKAHALKLFAEREVNNLKGVIFHVLGTTPHAPAELSYEIDEFETIVKF